MAPSGAGQFPLDGSSQGPGTGAITAKRSQSGRSLLADPLWVDRGRSGTGPGRHPKERDWFAPAGTLCRVRHSHVSQMLPAALGNRSLPFSSQVWASGVICSLIGLREVRLLERLRDRFCPKRAQSTSEAAFDINNALAFEGCDLGDGSASRNPTDAALFKRRKYPFLHDKNRGWLRRGRRRVWHGVPPLKHRREASWRRPKKKGCRRDLVDGSQLPREEAGNLKSLLRLLSCYVITDHIRRFMELRYMTWR